MLDGQPIVAVAIDSSDNKKTGNMIQVHILRADLSPVEALWQGKDSSICGNCPHRGPTGDGKGRSCYVTVFQGPAQVYKAFAADKYAESKGPALFRNRQVRFGAYGDPAALPLELLRAYARVAAGFTAYTHQWRTVDAGYADVCMASADNVQDRLDAKAKGYRTFRVRLPDEPIAKGEFSCPASEESGKRLNCNTCMACSGTRFGKVAKAGDVTIIAHGNGGHKGNAKRNLTALTVAGKLS